MRNAEWLDEIIHDELFVDDQDATDTHVGGNNESEWGKRMLRTFLAEGERNV